MLVKTDPNVHGKNTPSQTHLSNRLMSTRMQKNDVLSECIADKKFYGDMVDDAW